MTHHAALPEEPLFRSPYDLLKALQGDWKGATSTWFQPGELTDVSNWTGSITSSLEGRFIHHSYRGMMLDEPLEGFAIMGYCNTPAQWESAWTDSLNMGTGMMCSSGGAWIPGSRSFSVLGSYIHRLLGTTWGWRTQVDWLSLNGMSVRHFNIDPEGEEALAIDTQYERR